VECPTPASRCPSAWLGLPAASHLSYHRVIDYLSNAPPYNKRMTEPGRPGPAAPRDAGDGRRGREGKGARSRHEGETMSVDVFWQRGCCCCLLVGWSCVVVCVCTTRV